MIRFIGIGRPIKRLPVLAVVMFAMTALFGSTVLASGREGKGPSKKEAPIPVVSPWDGTFYAGEYAGAVPYVAVGSQVQAHTVVCIVEAMRPFAIRAGIEGAVRDVLVDDGEMVKAGQVLMLIQPPDPPFPASIRVLP